jgi:hypothetical protein
LIRKFERPLVRAFARENLESRLTNAPLAVEV